MSEAQVRPDVVELLRCPHGEVALTLEERSLVCPAGHRFDLARQGYVNLLTGPAPAGVETADMVAARAELQQAGHHDALTDALADAVTDALDARGVLRGPASADPPTGTAPAVVELGAGTGHHLARVLAAMGSDPVGLAVDLSKHAARRAARAHPRIGSVVADVWGELPIRDDVADAVLVVFAPRNAAEIGRILRAGGTLVVATPAAGHLAPLVERLELLGTEPAKLDHLDAQLAEVVTLQERRELSWHRHLDRDAVAALVASGPNAWHTDPGVLHHHLDELAEPIEVTFAVTISTYRR